MFPERSTNQSEPEIDIEDRTSELIKWNCGGCVYISRPSEEDPRYQCMVFGEYEESVINALQNGDCEHYDNGANITSGEDYLKKLADSIKKAEATSVDSSVVERA
jgi:hypothetical protein